MSISWIQLSDLHFGQGQSAGSKLDKALVLERLLDDIGHVRDQLGRPDYVFVTGDIAYSGKRIEFEAAGNWFARLTGLLEIELDQVFLVPGNHDVDRDRTKDALVNSVHVSMRRDPGLLSKLLDEDRADVIWYKLDEYHAFAGEFGTGVSRPQSPCWGVRLRGDPAPVYLVGLNSALQCFDDDDDTVTSPSGQNLQLSSWQLDRALKGCPEDALLILLLHHPPELLRDRLELMRYLSGRPFIALYGHVHSQKAFEMRSLGGRGDHLCFVAGAGHDAGGGSIHAYAWGNLNKDGLQWYPRQWSAATDCFVGAPLDPGDEEVKTREGVGLFVARSRQDLERSLGSWAKKIQRRTSSSVEVEPSPNPFEPRPFPRARLTPTAMAQAAFRLYQSVVRSGYDPDVLIGMNQGGLVVAAAMMQYLHNAQTYLGGAFCVKRDAVYKIRFMSLPGHLDEGGRWRLVRPKRVLVVDSKFKSGVSAEAIYRYLRRKYREDVEIRFAVALSYGGWPGRWDRPSRFFPWPAQLLENGDIKAYISYYTRRAPAEDDIKESFRPGWEWEWTDMS